jgi:hypothetical protein
MEKYRLSKWVVGGDGENQTRTHYGVDKRFLLFWYKPLCYTKIVRYKDGNNSSSYEVLTFRNKFAADLEIENLIRGREQIHRRYYHNGRLVGSSRYKA